jgi:hypothetical protein
MTQRFVTNAFIAGELGKAFFGRTDLDKYDLSVALARNFFVDYRGGLSSRSGTRLCTELAGPAALYSYPLGDEEDDILLIFGNNTLSLYQSGVPLLDDEDDPIVLATPYTAAEARRLQQHTRNFVSIFTHLDHPRHRLLFDEEWKFEPVPDLQTLSPPNTISMTSNEGDTPTVGPARTVVVVTTVDEEGNEGISSIPIVMASLFNYTTEEGSGTITWDPVVGAASYRVYRSIIVSNNNLNRTQAVGFIGETKATTFVDSNITPDYTRQPPSYFSPFTNGTILAFKVVNGGTGYSANATVSVAGFPGSGFSGYPVVSTAGVVLGIVILNGGYGYPADAVVTITGGGSGAVVEIEEVSPDTGLNPQANTVLQQRRIYAGQRNAPNNLYGAAPGDEENFSSSSPPIDSDAYLFPLDAEIVSPIRSLLPIRDGLLVFHEKGVDRLGAAEGKTITPNNYSLEIQSSIGVGLPTPILVNDDVVFSTLRGTSIIALNYTFYTNSYSAQDVSILSAHLLGEGRQPVRMEWSQEPARLLWICREDGRLLALTYMREQEIYGWTQHETAGFVADICVVREDLQDTLYLCVDRGFGWFLERLEERTYENVDQFWGVDCGLRYEGVRHENGLAIVEGETTATLTASGSFESNIGSFVRMAGGLYEITAAVGGVATATIRRKAAKRHPATKNPRPGVWYIAAPVTTVSGLAHLNGQTVAVLADGDVLEPRVVVDGSIDLEGAYSMVLVGLPFVAEAKTLPLTAPELQSDGRKKRIVGTAVRLNETRGLAIGTKTLYEMRDKTWNDWGDVTELRDDNTLIVHKARWERDAQLTFRQAYPLPATVLGFVVSAEMED